MGVLRKKRMIITKTAVKSPKKKTIVRMIRVSRILKMTMVVTTILLMRITKQALMKMEQEVFVTSKKFNMKETREV